MIWPREFGFFDYIEFIGLLLAFLDFSGLSVRLERAIDSRRANLSEFLRMNFLRTMMHEETRVRSNPDEWYDTYDIKTGEKTGLESAVPTYITTHSIDVALQNIEEAVSERFVPTKYGYRANLVLCILLINLSKIVYLLLLIVSALIVLVVAPFWFALYLINKPEAGTVGTVSFGVALVGFYGSRLADS